MKKQALLRGLLGFPLGIALNCILAVIISVIIGDGHFYPCVPTLVESVGSEIWAVTIQVALSGLLGASFAAASVIWEIEDWSIAKQTATYFFVTAIAMLPIAYLTEWMEHTLIGFLIYFGVFLVIFFVIWLFQYFYWIRKIRALNMKTNHYNLNDRSH